MQLDGGWIFAAGLAARLRSALFRVSLCCAVDIYSIALRVALAAPWCTLRCAQIFELDTFIGKRVGASEAPIFGIQWLGSRLEQVSHVSGHSLTVLPRASTGCGATSLRCVCCSNAHTHSSPRISTPPRSRAARNAPGPAVKRSFVRARCRWTPPPWRPSV